MRRPQPYRVTRKKPRERAVTDTGKAQMLADLAYARQLSAEGKTQEARALLAQYNLSYIAVEIVPGEVGQGRDQVTDYRATVTLTVDVIVNTPSPDHAADEARRIVRSWVGPDRGLAWSQVHDVVLSEYTLADRMRRENQGAWQIEELVLTALNGDQRTRWRTGKMAEDELLDIARPLLFWAFKDLPRWRPMNASAVTHADGDCQAAEVVWSTHSSPVLSASEWVKLDRINEAVLVANQHPWLHPFGPQATVVTRIHRGVCQKCKCAAAGASALVSIRFGGNTLTREYAL